MPDEKEKKLSQEEKRFANLAKRFIRQMSIATKNFRMFGENHPVLINSIRNIYELLKITLAGRNAVTYTFLEGVFLVEDIPLKDIDPKVYSFIPEVKECGITSLTFLSGINEEELKILFIALSSGPAFVKDEGGIINLLRKKNIAHIKADEVYFKKVSIKEEEAQEAKTQLADMLVVDYLLGKTSMPKDKLKTLAKDISLAPKRMGAILSDVSKKAGETGHNAAGFTCAKIDKLVSEIKGADAEEGKKIKKNVGNLILALEPSLRSEVLRSDDKACQKSDFIKDAIAEFSDEVIIKIIASDFVDRKSSVVETRKLIRRILPEAPRRARIFPILEKRLIQKGVPQKVCSELLEGKFWADMTDEEKVRSIEKHEPLYSVEIGIVPEIGNLISNLLAEKKFNRVHLIVDKILQNLSSEDMGLKIRLVRDFAPLAISLFKSTEYPHKHKILGKLDPAFKNTKETELRERFMKLFTSLTSACMKNKFYGNIPDLITIAGYESVKDSMLKDTSLEKFLNGLLLDEKTGKKIIKRLSQAIGKGAQDALCDILISIEKDDFDSYKKRNTIAMILKDTAEDAEIFLIEKLKSDKTAVLKNALEALSEIGTEKSLESIRKFTGHADEKIQKRAEVALKKIEKRALPSLDSNQD
ncbi:MAG: HEAT repeat domain-containing protein [Candidatus Omnitrophota bacterium]